VFSNLFSITLPNIEKYFSEIHFPGIHFPWNSLSKKKLLSSKQTGPIYFKIVFHFKYIKLIFFLCIFNSFDVLF
jgi:hypothetical protein